MTVYTSSTSRSSNRLLSLPSELRRNIYQYTFPDQVHLRCQDGITRISRCVQPYEDRHSPRNWNHGGWERKSHTEISCRRDPILGRRVQSTWGPHWKCEEHAHIEDEEMTQVTSLLRSCKDMFVDIVDQLCGIAVLHITDLETIDYIVQCANNTSGELRMAALLSNRISRLHMTLRLPLHFYQSLESAGGSEMEPGPTAIAKKWQQLGSNLSQMAQLRKLHLWLDHDDICSWSTLNEHAIVQPIISQLRDSGLEITLALPNLHPLLESETRHFIRHPPSNTFLCRNARQHVHVAVKDGRPQIVYSRDFPVLRFSLEYHDQPIDEVEEVERAMWKEGIDVERWVIETTGNGPELDI
ncbi:hypothetical protein IQ07DRAFT_592364 [Pyrenochaeta sp. DS3sAY3a]|nr:hypothetical protein IQ07DRAFT_592364 [Pyrenochaeta sp. DS3sAY3a]